MAQSLETWKLEGPFSNLTDFDQPEGYESFLVCLQSFKVHTETPLSNVGVVPPSFCVPAWNAHPVNHRCVRAFPLKRFLQMAT